MEHKTVSFELNGMLFEYDEEKEPGKYQKNTEYPSEMLPRVFFDYDRIEFYDEETEEDRFDTIGDTSAGNALLTRQGVSSTMIGDISRFTAEKNDILYVVYTERYIKDDAGKERDVTRIISARLATPFERGLYYGKSD